MSPVPLNSPQREQPDNPKTVSRRRALTRLGLAAGAAYAAPTLTTLDRRAYAAPTNCPPPHSKGGGPPWCNNKK